ncbi:MAG: efflux RND transporter periplasmic adaptor subunit [Rhodomicrobium sp.]
MPSKDRKQGRGFRWGQLLLIAIAAGLAFGAYRVWTNPANEVAAQTAPAAVPVQTMAVTPRSIQITRPGLGTVQAWQMVNITPQVSGRIAEIPFREGRTAQKGAVLVRLDLRPFQAALDQAKAKKAQDQANLANTQKNLSRDETLLTKGGFATQQTVDNERAQVLGLQAAIEGDNAAIETAQLNLEYGTVQAPFTGVVSLRNIDAGNLVNTSTVIGTITEIEPIAVDFTLPQSDLADIQEAAAHGTPAVLVFDESGKTQLSKGVLDVINNQIDQASGTIKLKARFDNKDHKLWPGEFVQAQVVIRTEPEALAVPSEAVQHGPNGAYVWLVSPKDTVRRQPIEIGAIEGGETVIASGVKAGERVVLAGQYGLTQGAHIVETKTAQTAEGQG